MMLRKFLFIAVMAAGISAYAQQDHTQPGTPMPAMRLGTVDTQSADFCRKHPDLVTAAHTRIYTGDDFMNKSPLLVMIFNPNCGHCEDQAERIMKRIDMFRRSKLVMITDTMNNVYLPHFIQAFGLDKHKDVVTVGADLNGFIKEAYLYQALPQICIYDKDRKLVRNFAGGAAMDSLAQYIR